MKALLLRFTPAGQAVPAFDRTLLARRAAIRFPGSLVMSGPRPIIIKVNPAREEYLEAENELLRAGGECVTYWAFFGVH